jgi:hypothetical protein
MTVAVMVVALGDGHRQVDRSAVRREVKRGGLKYVTYTSVYLRR